MTNQMAFIGKGLNKYKGNEKVTQLNKKAEKEINKNIQQLEWVL